MYDKRGILKWSKTGSEEVCAQVSGYWHSIFTFQKDSSWSVHLKALFLQLLCLVEWKISNKILSFGSLLQICCANILKCFHLLNKWGIHISNRYIKRVYLILTYNLWQRRKTYFSASFVHTQGHTWLNNHLLWAYQLVETCLTTWNCCVIQQHKNRGIDNIIKCWVLLML